MEQSQSDAGMFPGVNVVDMVPRAIDWLKAEIYETAVEHGWWDEGTAGRDEAPGPSGDRSFGDLIALMHSELSEALEEFRDGRRFTEVYYNESDQREVPKPEGIPIELADVIIRIFDFCGRYDVDIATAIIVKMAYNKTRPYRHGGRSM